VIVQALAVDAVGGDGLATLPTAAMARSIAGATRVTLAGVSPSYVELAPSPCPVLVEHLGSPTGVGSWPVGSSPTTGRFGATVAG
jgi:hypothetical protein